MRNPEEIEKSRAGYQYVFVLAFVWTVLVAVSLTWNIRNLRRNTIELALKEADISYVNDVAYKRWNAVHGGVYVPVTEKTQPNPYLAHVPERDIATPSGRELTLMNPSYMTRQVRKIKGEEYEIYGHITSLKPIRPENAPDPWETEALHAFERGETKVGSLEGKEGEEYMRVMYPFVTEKPCLKCHKAQGYEVGDIRGGISVSVPMAPLWRITSGHKLVMSLGHFFLWMIGIGVIGLVTGRQLKSERMRFKAKEALIESERSNRTLIENLPGAVYRVFLREENRMQFFNDVVRRITGFSKDELVKGEVCSIDPMILPEDRERIISTVKNAVEDGAPFEIEYRIRHRDNTIRYFNERGRPIMGRDGKPLYIDGVIFDVTGQKKAEEELKLDEERLKTLLKLSKLAWETERDLTDFALEEGVRLTGSTVGYLHFFSEDRKTIQLYSWSKEVLKGCTAEKDLHYPLEKAGVWADCVRWRKPVIHNDYQDLPDKKGYPEGHFPVIRHMSVPVFDGDEIVAVAGVGNKEGEYNESDVRQLALFMNSMWSILKQERAEAALKNAHDELEMRVAERTSELRASEERFRVLFDSGYDAIFVHGFSDDGMPARFIEVNSVACERLGYSKGELLGLSPPDISAPDMLEKMPETMNSIHADGHAIFEMVHVTKDGRRIPVEISGHKFILNDQPFMLSIARDITERKRAEKALREEKEFTEKTIDTQIDTFFVFDPKTGKAVRWNKRFSEVSGYSDEEIADMKAPDAYYSSEDLEKAMAETEKILSSGQGRLEVSLICKDRRIVPTEYLASIIEDEEGNPKYIVLVGRDITERRKAEEKIRQQLYELQRWHALTLDREDRVQELKTEVNTLLERSGEPHKYGRREEGTR